MGKPKAPTPPPPPDPYATAAAQTTSNRETAIANANLNRIDQHTPYGSIIYNVEGTNADGTPRYSQTQTLNPAQQALLDQTNAQNGQINRIAGGYMGRIEGQMGQPFDTSSLPGMRSSASTRPMLFNLGDTGRVQEGLDYSGVAAMPGAGDFSADRQRVEEALYARLNPQLKRDEDDLRTRLANQGILQGTEAFDREMDALNRSRTDARMQTVLAGGQEQSRMFDLGLSARQQGVSEVNNRGQFANMSQAQRYAQALSSGQFSNDAAERTFSQDLTNANLTNQARQQAMQEQAWLRSLPLNEFNSLRSATPIQQPNFTGIEPVAMQGTNIGQYITDNYAAQQNIYNQQQAARNNFTSGLFSLAGSAALAASDIRVKRDITRIGETPGGVGVYEFRYLADNDDAPLRTGVMAQEVMQVRPDAVVDIGGVLHVDYARVI